MKFDERVEQITFSGQLAAEKGKPVLYVTERCVFQLGREGLELVEVAPGVDVERNIVAHMRFRPIINTVRPMDTRLFAPEPSDLRARMLDLNCWLPTRSRSKRIPAEPGKRSRAV